MTRWPWPGDTPTDRARRIAQRYRDALLITDPDTCAALDRRNIAEGQTWVAPRLAHIDVDDVVTVPEAADHVGLTAAAVYKWITRDRKLPHHEHDGRIYVRLGDVFDVHAQHRRRRAGNTRG